METRQRFGELDGYRGLAALAVVLYHADCALLLRDGHYIAPATLPGIVLRNLEAGVNWFFVLSGLVITLPFARALCAGQPLPSLRAYAARRARRILPAYYVALALVCLVTARAGTLTPRDLIEHLTLTHIFDARNALSLSTLSVAWSLADEAIYYAVVAIVALVLGAPCRRRTSPRQRAALLATVAASAMLTSLGYRALVALIWHVPATTLSVYFGPLYKGDGFALGALLAMVVAARAGRPLVTRRVAWSLRGLALALISVAFLARFVVPLIGVYFDTANSLAAAAVIASTVLAIPDSGWARWFAARPLAALGAISYSCYLYHQPLGLGLWRLGWLPPAAWQVVIVFVALGIGAGALSYRYAERPWLPARSTRQQLEPVDREVIVRAARIFAGRGEPECVETASGHGQWHARGLDHPECQTAPIEVDCP